MRLTIGRWFFLGLAVGGRWRLCRRLFIVVILHLEELPVLAARYDLVVGLMVTSQNKRNDSDVTEQTQNVNLVTGVTCCLTQ